jgi:hypothetical protein
VGNLALRIMSAAVLAPLAVLAAYLGGWPFALFWGVAAAAVLWEWVLLVTGPVWIVAGVGYAGIMWLAPMLLRADAVEALCKLLIPMACMITPNLPEAAALLDAPVARDESEMRAQAEKLMALGARAVLIKGGHDSGAESVDLLIEATGVTRLVAPRLATKNTHGTGCTLSSAIAAGLAKGAPLDAMVAEFYGAFYTFRSDGTLRTGFARDFRYDRRGLVPPYYPSTPLMNPNSPLARTVAWKEM